MLAFIEISTDMPTVLADFEKARLRALTKVGTLKSNEETSRVS
jgi:hypothetical protein